MELTHLNELEKATKKGRGQLSRLGIGLLFIIGVMLYTVVRVDVTHGGSLFIVIAAMIGGYMAMNIGANDVANNVGPAVGSRALTLGGALIIAAIFEAAGAIIAGGEVVGTIRSGIIDPNLIGSADTFVWIMMAALLAAAIWLNIATAMGAPVSTTHSIVGAVLGAGIASSGLGIADWDTVAKIVASWVISPVMGGAIAAAFLYLIKRTITYRTDLVASSRQAVPYLVAAMAFAFGTYLMLKGLNRIWNVNILQALRTVGSEITELDQMRAYCIAMAATVTVILASRLGLPISTTHVAVGAVFGVGFLREYLKSQYARMLETIKGMLTG